MAAPLHPIHRTWSHDKKCLQSHALYRQNTENSKQIFPEMEFARPQSHFLHSFVCERLIYSHDRSAYSAAGKFAYRSWEYINRLQAHECGKLGLRPPQFLFREYINGIFVAVCQQNVYLNCFAFLLVDRFADLLCDSVAHLLAHRVTLLLIHCVTHLSVQYQHYYIGK